MQQWWPVATHSVSGTGSQIDMTPQGCFETAPDGTVSTWGEVLEWDEPRRIVHTWHPGSPSEPHTVVTVTFTPADHDATVVELTHDGWVEAGASASDHDDYDEGWDYVLDCFAHFAG